MFFYDKLIDTIEKANREIFTKEEILCLIKMQGKCTFDADIESNGVQLLPNLLAVKQGDRVDILPRKEFKLLYLLILNKNKVITRDNALRSCWEDDVIVIERTIDVHIVKLRKILIDASPLKTRKTQGYIWIEE